MEITPVLDVDEIDLSDQPFWTRPTEEREGAFAALRKQRPVAFFEEPDLTALIGLERGPGYWALTRHADVLTASRSPGLFSSDSQYGGTQIIDLPSEYTEFFGGMINMDDPRHAKQRRIVSASFTPGMLKKIDDDVATAAREVINAVVEKGECDFVADIAAPFPLKIICDMMGIPRSQYAFVFDRSNLILGAGDPDYVAENADIMTEQLTAGAELAALMGDLRTARLKTPCNDLVSALVNTEIDGECLSGQDLASFFILLVVAGNETTRNAISHGVKALFENPEQKELWARDFEGVAPTAVEEIVRWASPVIHFRRTVLADTVIGGQTIRAGEKVVLWYNSANRDEEVFEEPYSFKVTRTPNEHVGFGGPGPHFCLGANLARREIKTIFAELFEHLPDIEITGEAEMLKSWFIHGIKRMPVRFSPGPTTPA
ncbi:MAG: cytochrome P450 [Deltaproteobacteria bacterium]